MALKPADRYASAHHLANDLEHWMADEAISVYREPISTRLTRWGRRHRTAAVAIGVLLVTAVLGLTAGTMLLSRANTRAERQRRRAEESAQILSRQLYINRINLGSAPGKTPTSSAPGSCSGNAALARPATPTSAASSGTILTGSVARATGAWRGMRARSGAWRSAPTAPASPQAGKITT